MWLSLICGVSKMARPIKYKERMQNISIALEPSVIKWLEDEANKRHMSRNEYITFLLHACISMLNACRSKLDAC